MRNPTKTRFAETRKELAEKYFSFGSTIETYSKGNMGLVSLMSDIQESINFGCVGQHEIDILNDIKCVLINYERKGLTAE